MTELKDVVQELVEKTESGELEWSAHDQDHYWSITQHGCTFLAYPGKTPRLRISLQPKGTAGQFSHGDIAPLIECLATKFPFVDTTADDALAAALACLAKG